jgi:hypothetical protein
MLLVSDSFGGYSFEFWRNRHIGRPTKSRLSLSWVDFQSIHFQSVISPDSFFESRLIFQSQLLRSAMTLESGIRIGRNQHILVALMNCYQAHKKELAKVWPNPIKRGRLKTSLAWKMSRDWIFEPTDYRLKMSRLKID